MLAARLTDAICKATGLTPQQVAVTIGRPAEPATWSVALVGDADPALAPAAQNALAAFNPALPEVPAQVSQWQARSALKAAGLLDDVETLIGQLGAASDAALAWNHAPFIRRDSPLVAALAPGLGLDESALDALFIDAGARTL